MSPLAVSWHSAGVSVPEVSACLSVSLPGCLYVCLSVRDQLGFRFCFTSCTELTSWGVSALQKCCRQCLCSWPCCAVPPSAWTTDWWGPHRWAGWLGNGSAATSTASTTPRTASGQPEDTTTLIWQYDMSHSCALFYAIAIGCVFIPLWFSPSRQWEAVHGHGRPTVRWRLEGARLRLCEHRRLLGVQGARQGRSTAGRPQTVVGN